MLHSARAIRRSRRPCVSSRRRAVPSVVASAPSSSTAVWSTVRSSTAPRPSSARPAVSASYPRPSGSAGAASQMTGSSVSAFSAADAEMVRPIHRVTLVVLGLYALAILSIGLSRDWRLLHEDNGAMHTTLALSHLELGLATTRAHDVFFNPRTGETFRYGHHPPGIALIVAGAFLAIGSDAPWVARLIVIGFHLASIFLLVELLTRVLPRATALLGGFLMATLPMSAYFGRMVNYEPACLFAILLQLTGYATFKQDGARKGLVRLSLGIVLGGLIDWGAFFFAAAITIALVADALGSSPRGPLAPLAVPVGSAVAIALFDLWHLWYAGHGSMPLVGMVSQQWPTQSRGVAPLAFAHSQFEVVRRYYTHAGLVSVLLAAVVLALPQTALARTLFVSRDAALLPRLLAITGGTACMYLLAAPSWAKAHAYWQFYALPFVVISMLLVWQALRRSAEGRHPLIARCLLVAFILDVSATSIATLHYRHTTPSPHALRQTAHFRSLYATPASFQNAQRGDSSSLSAVGGTRTIAPSRLRIIP